MTLVKNWISINFQKAHCKIWLHGFFPPAVVPENALLYAQGGMHYFWPLNQGFEAPNDDDETPEFRFVPKLVEAIVAHGLLLAGKGAVVKEKGKLFFKHKEHVFELKVLRPASHQKQFHLLISVGKADNARQAYRQAKEAIAALSQFKFDNGCGTAFELGEGMEISDLEAPQSFDKPSLYFRPGGIEKHIDKWTGLETYGPFPNTNLRDKQLNCLLVAPMRKQTRIKEYLGELRNGLPEVREGADYPFEKGWEQFFRFGGWTTKDCWLEQPLHEEASRKQMKNFVSNKSNGFDLALVAIQAHEFESALPLLADLLQLGIPFQILDLAALRLPDYARAQSLQQLALNAYVKVGGIPWLLSLKHYDGRLVVVGIGSTELEKGVAGYCTLFKRDGLFRLGNSSLKPSREAWAEELCGFVEQQLRRLAEEDNWKKGEEIDLVFHVSLEVSEAKLSELKTVLQAAFEFTYNCNFTFLRIGYDPDQRFWDLARSGKGSKGKGAYVPDQGHACFQGNRGLLQLRPLHHPEVEAAPLSIELHSESYASDLEGLTNQIFQFAAFSWRNTGFGCLPATLEYGNALTHLLFQLDRQGLTEQVETALLAHPQLKTWFL